MTPGQSPNREILVIAATSLRPMLDELVFVGGHVAELLVADPGAQRIRATDDVDVVVEASTYSEYHRLTQRLLSLGFERDTSAGAPTCRWLTPRVSSTRVRVDVMPTDDSRMGETNPWYPLGIVTAERYSLAADLVIRILAPPAFLATKCAAFASRGNGDLLLSRDVEDIIAVVAGRPSIVAEIASALPPIQAFVAASLTQFLSMPDFDVAIEDAVPDARLVAGYFEVIRKRFVEIGTASGRTKY